MKKHKNQFTSDGFIDRKGKFYPSLPFHHARTAMELFNKSDMALEDEGWIMVWSYQSFLDKEPTPYFRFIYSEHTITKEQINTMCDWCKERKVTLQRALGKVGFMLVFPDAPTT